MAEAVARGSLVLSLDAQQLNKGLNKAAKDAKAKGSEIAKSFKDSSKEKIGEVFGGGSLVGMGAKAGIAGLAVAGLAVLGHELYQLAVNAREFHKELERGEDVTKKWADGITEGIAEANRRLTEFDDIAGTAEGLNGYQRELAAAEAKLRETGATLTAATGDVDKWDSKWNSTAAFGKWVRGELEETENSAKKQKEQIKAADEAARKHAENLRKTIAERQNALTNPEARKALRDFIAEQNDAIKDLDGRSAEERQLDKLKDKFGFKDAELAAARLAAQQKVAAQNAREAGDFIKQLSDEVGVFGQVVQKTSDDVKLDELVKKGADQEQIARIRALIEAKKKLNQQYTPLQALERGTAAEITFQNKTKFEEARDKAVRQQLDELKKQNKILGDIRDGVKKLDVDTPEI